MNNQEFIQAVLRKASRRRRWQRASDELWIGLAFGAVVWVLLLILYKLLPLSPWVPVAGAAQTLLWMIGGGAWGFARREPLIQTARWLDLKQDFKEQISTAWEYSQSGKQDRWRELLLEKAGECAKKTDARRLAPWHLPKQVRWALVALALGAGLAFVPEYRTAGFRQKQLDRSALQDAGQHLAALAKLTLERRPPALPQTQKNLENLEALGQQLNRAKLTRSDALKDLAKLSDKVREQVTELGHNPALRKMTRASREMGERGEPSLADLQKQIESLQKAVGQAGNSKALEKLKEALSRAQSAAAAMKESPGSAAQRQELASALSQLGQQAQSMNLDLPGLQEAMAALAAAKADEALKDLDASEIAIEQLEKMAQALTDLRRQAEKLGKDLAEQLERGQADLAQARLMKMAEQLQSPSLSKEQLQKILQEVQKALPASADYGKAQDFLKAGADQMQKGQASAAAASLQAAARELAKLMEEANDANSLLASLDALQKAQMCVGN